MENNVYASKEDIIDYVLNEYRKYDTELNSLFFDFHVRLKEKILLKAYAEIQYIVNGDDVIRLENPNMSKNKDDDVIITGKEVDLIPDGAYENVYDGNYKDFLENFNGKESETGLCRMMDSETDEEDIVHGIKLDFIF